MPAFVDTNVFVYARDTGESQKQPRALEWVSSLWRARSGRTSYQVLQEFYVTVTEKLNPGLDRDEARADVHALLSWRPVEPNELVLTRACEFEDRYDLSWWDSLIVASAHVARCDRLISEDLQDGQDLGGVVVVDPFEHPPDGGGSSDQS